MAIQNSDKKQLIDVGEIGNASTGDILFDGGEKINVVFDQLYNAFGDRRLFSTAQGVGLQTLHGTGYFQHGTATSFISPVPNGSQYDIDTSTGSVNVRLSKGKQGEMVRFINSNGSFSNNNPFIVIPNDTFRGNAGELRVTAPYVIITCICVSDANGFSVWDYSIESLFGQKQIPIERTTELNNTVKVVPIAHKNEYTSIKLLMTAVSSNGAKMKSSEVNLLVDPIKNAVHSTEFASLRIGGVNEEDEIYDAVFSINAAGLVIVSVKSVTAGMKLAIKTIATQKIGVTE